MALPTTLSPLFLFTATVVLVLVSLSSPIIHGIYLLDIHAVLDPSNPPPSVATTLHFGVWGWCATAAANPDAAHCSNRTVGYTVPEEVVALTGQPAAVVNVISEGLTFILVLHPLAAVFSLFALLPGVMALYTWSPHAWGIASLVLSFLAAFTASISAAIDVALVAIAKSRFEQLDLGLNIAIDYGPAVWMTVAAAGMLWIEVMCASVVVCDCFGFGIEHEVGRTPGVHVNQVEKANGNGTGNGVV
ncbi:hypothetical protein EXIGLDRAFT_776615 [Exidia glandulosa HHB12029]|uniref:Pali-domain-containing protein n=1 Tax=Exidia glandulosa HHB12029 TaxID=1314781 RepID=A0A165DEK1_EXIGL|nr:hypothetical protein EXIGLDRAFT_776615 [Exidia glandulosa HHB12029]